jgi:hypothetical protein
MKVRVGASLWQLVLGACLMLPVANQVARAQATPPSAAGPAPANAADAPVPATLPDDGSVPDDYVPRSRSRAIGGGSEAPLKTHHTSPLESIGFGIGGSAYVLSAGVAFVYVTTVLPFGAIFAGAKVHPVLFWLFLPIGGPLFAQQDDSLKHQPVWRAILIGDGVLQGTGLVLGLIGVALSGSGSRSSQPGFDVSLGVDGSTATGFTLRWRTL